MAEFTTRRVVAVAAIAGALVGGAVAGAVGVASTGANGSGAASSGAPRAVRTASVVRTDLTTSVQVSGSIGYSGSYTVAAPSGSSPQQVAQAQEAVTQDQQTLSADEQIESDTSSADSQQVSSSQAAVGLARSSLSADQQKEASDCQGSASASSSSQCGSDEQKVSQDQAQLSQANQQLATAQATATRDHDQNEAKVVADRTTLQGDQATLASLETSAVNPGTTYTSLPKAGDVIKEGQPVYSLNNEPVPLLYGSVAAYRAFSLGMSDGADVGKLTQDLIALGYGAGLAQSDHYSSATAAAVERWQRALGLPVTGEILLGEVVFEPGPIRVTSVTPSVGETVGAGGAGGGGGGGGGGAVLTATSTTPVVTVSLVVSQEYLVKPGDAVSIVLPNGTSTVGGHIETVGNVATCPGGGGTATNNGGGSAGQSPCASGGSNGSSTPTVTVTITLDSTTALASLDQAPVNVSITTQTARNVLAVPVNALLALKDGGFGVDVVSGNTTHLVGVTTGLYSNTLVQISGSGVEAGMRVQVPSS